MKYQQKRELSLENLLGEGSEGVIYYTSNPEIVYKEFRENAFTKEDRLRKQKKLEYIASIQKLEGCYPLIAGIILDGSEDNPVGYLMEYVKGKFLGSDSLTLEQKMSILQDIKQILEIFSKYGIYYFDIAERNILLTDENIKLLDMDNVLTREYDLDIMPVTLREYILKGGTLDKHGVTAMFNLFTQDFLNREKYHLKKTGRKVLRDLQAKRPDSAFDHEYLYEYIRR